MPSPDEGDEWADGEAGPIVRPYALTGGRTRHSAGEFDLMAVVETVDGPSPGRFLCGPEHGGILRLCRSAQSVAEVAAELDLPVHVVRVLLGDLADQGLVAVRAPSPVAGDRGTGVLRQVIDGLHAL